MIHDPRRFLDQKEIVRQVTVLLSLSCALRPLFQNLSHTAKHQVSRPLIAHQSEYIQYRNTHVPKPAHPPEFFFISLIIDHDHPKIMITMRKCKPCRHDPYLPVQYLLLSHNPQMCLLKIHHPGLIDHRIPPPYLLPSLCQSTLRGIPRRFFPLDHEPWMSHIAPRRYGQEVLIRRNPFIKQAVAFSYHSGKFRKLWIPIRIYLLFFFINDCDFFLLAFQVMKITFFLLFVPSP